MPFYGVRANRRQPKFNPVRERFLISCICLVLSALSSYFSTKAASPAVTEQYWVRWMSYWPGLDFLKRNWESKWNVKLYKKCGVKVYSRPKSARNSRRKVEKADGCFWTVVIFFLFLLGSVPLPVSLYLQHWGIFTFLCFIHRTDQRHKNLVGIYLLEIKP